MSIRSFLFLSFTVCKFELLLRAMIDKFCNYLFYLPTNISLKSYSNNSLEDHPVNEQRDISRTEVIIGKCMAFQ